MRYVVRKKLEITQKFPYCSNFYLISFKGPLCSKIRKTNTKYSLEASFITRWAIRSSLPIAGMPTWTLCLYPYLMSSLPQQLLLPTSFTADVMRWFYTRQPVVRRRKAVMYLIQDYSTTAISWPTKKSSNKLLKLPTHVSKRFTYSALQGSRTRIVDIYQNLLSKVIWRNYFLIVARRHCTLHSLL